MTLCDFRVISNAFRPGLPRRISIPPYKRHVKQDSTAFLKEKNPLSELLLNHLAQCFLKNQNTVNRIETAKPWLYLGARIPLVLSKPTIA